MLATIEFLKQLMYGCFYLSMSVLAIFLVVCLICVGYAMIRDLFGFGE